MGASPSVCRNNSCGCYNLKRSTISQSLSNENVRTISVKMIPEDLGWQEQQLYTAVDEEIPEREIGGKLEVLDDEVNVTSKLNKDFVPDSDAASEHGGEVETEETTDTSTEGKTEDVVTGVQTGDSMADTEMEDGVLGAETDDLEAGAKVEDKSPGAREEDVEADAMADNFAAETQAGPSGTSAQINQLLATEEHADMEKLDISESENETEIFEQAESEPLIGGQQHQDSEQTPTTSSTPPFEEILLETPAESPAPSKEESNSTTSKQHHVLDPKKSKSSTPFFSFFKKKKSNVHSTSDSDVRVSDDLVVIGTRIKPPADYEVEEFVDAAISIDEVKVAEIKRSDSAKKDDAGSGDDVTPRKDGDKASPGNQTNDKNRDSPEKVFGEQRGTVQFSPTKWMTNWMWG